MTKVILVSGDPTCDHNFYKGKRHTADSHETRGFRSCCTGGGALLLKELIAEAMKGEKQDDQEWITEYGLDPEFESLPLKYHSYCIWEPQVGGSDKASTEYWRAVEPPLGYGHSTPGQPAKGCPKPHADAYLPNPSGLSKSPDVVVLDDANIGFRDPVRRASWRLPSADSDQPSPRWVVLKLTGALGKNALWDVLAEQCKNNLVVIVPAENLRRSDVKISRGLSWEATAEDLTAELRNNPLLVSLLKARHLIVTFQSDGAFWVDNQPDDRKCMLVFDALRAEGEWSESQGKGGAFGYLSCFTTAVVRELCLPSDKSDPAKIKPDIEMALAAGLAASRELRRLGHGAVRAGEDEPEPGFPIKEIVSKIRQPNEKFVSTLIPQVGRERGGWMMLDEWHVQAQKEASPRPHYGAALAVALLGPSALERFPVARFGDYLTVDRGEIENLRTIRHLILNYKLSERQKKPLSIGVFGPPGAGKSFISLEIAKAAGIKEGDFKTFNLSQFSKPEDLFGAFHQVRDLILKGATPMILWDEFDAHEYHWLQYLLAPMDDGEFQDGQITHPIGKCIFMFAGATSATYEMFGPCNPDLLAPEILNKLDDPRRLEIEKSWCQFVLAKGPDFKSRLMGYMNLLGMNRRQRCVEEQGRRRWVDDETDLCCPIRRAFFIRASFRCFGDARLNVDHRVLRALLEIPHYRSAGRSVQVLCNHLKENGSGTLNRSALPGFGLLNMHVNGQEFWRICERNYEFFPLAERLARSFHEDWRKNPASRGNISNKPWEDLGESERLTNMQQVLRMEDNLSIIGLRIEKGKALPQDKGKKVQDHIDQHIEILAEAEHNGWMVERIIDGWRYGKIRNKDPEKKLHPWLIPYSQLPEDQKEKDRRPIRGFVPNVQQEQAGETLIEGYVDRLKRVGCRIVFSDVTPIQGGSLRAE